MLGLSCLHEAGAAPEEQLLAEGPFSLMAGVLFVAAFVAAIASPVVRARYRRRVTRLMALEQIQPRPPGWWVLPGQRPSATTRADPIAPGSALALQVIGAQAQRRIIRATMVAWAVFAIAPAVAAGMLGYAPTPAVRLLHVLAVALMAVGPVLTNLTPRGSRHGPLIGAVAVAAGAVLLDRAEPDVDSSLDEVVLGAVVLGAIYFAMFHRSLRGLMLPLLVLAGVATLAFVLPAAIVEPYVGGCFTGAGGVEAPALLLVGSTLVLLAPWLGFRAVAGLVRMVERDWFDDLSLPAFLMLVLVALAAVFGSPAARDGMSPGLAAMLVAWLAATVAAYALSLGPPPAAMPAPRLLILRVFARKHGQHALLDRLQQRWRYLGPVNQIGGPDLVALNVDAHECSMFLAGRLHELFLPEAASTEQLQSRLQTHADREGRFRINEVFCFNTAWRRTVEQLMHVSDAIVLDLRGFTRQREGTGYEIGLLARGGLVPRVVALGDASTNWPDVEALLREAGADPDRLVRVPEREGDESVFQHLLAAAARPAAPLPGAPATLQTA